MKATKSLLKIGVLSLSLLATGVMAAVSADEAAKLGTSLTPMGAEKAGNADGSITAWQPLSTTAGSVDAKGFLSDPYGNDKPKFTITAQNVDQYKDKLSPGQLAMFKRYPDTFKLPVYPTQRGSTVPDSVFAAIKKNATTTNLVAGGNGLENFQIAIPFPIPKSGVEVIWNHITRYRGGGVTRVVNQATPQQNGSYSMVKLEEQFMFRDRLKDFDPANPGNVLFYFKQKVTAPPRLAGTVLLVHETLDQVKEPRMAWQYNSGQRRVRRAPQVAYDSPGPGNLRTNDQMDMFNGSPDRYDWQLVGKKELYIPYNSYRLADPANTADDLIHPGHLNQDKTRYELHRVWEVIATLKPNERHIYSKRHLFLDEDTWSIVEGDHYDSRGDLWRVSENHLLSLYDMRLSISAAEMTYDLTSGRYLANYLINSIKDAYQFGLKSRSSDFTPAALRNIGIR